MSEEDPQECAEPVEPAAQAPSPKTSDYYCVDENLPVRFNNPAWFKGYRETAGRVVAAQDSLAAYEGQEQRTKVPVSVYRTSNQAYGGRAPTVHEMPKVFYAKSSKFSRQLAAAGMFQNNSFNVYLEKSIVTGVDNCITTYDRLNFHPSYNASRPSICSD